MLFLPPFEAQEAIYLSGDFQCYSEHTKWVGILTLCPQELKQIDAESQDVLFGYFVCSLILLVVVCRVQPNRAFCTVESPT